MSSKCNAGTLESSMFLGKAVLGKQRRKMRLDVRSMHSASHHIRGRERCCGIAIFTRLFHLRNVRLNTAQCTMDTPIHRGSSMQSSQTSESLDSLCSLAHLEEIRLMKLSAKLGIVCTLFRHVGHRSRQLAPRMSRTSDLHRSGGRRGKGYCTATSQDLQAVPNS